MVAPLPHRVLLTILVGLMMVGCALPPPEKPIILRRPLADRRTVRPTPTRRPAAVSQPVTQPEPSPATPEATLTPEQKTDLFRQFDEYLSKPAPR